MDEPRQIPIAESLAFLRRALPPPPARVLDAGCGTGALTAALAAAGWSVRGIDVDPRRVNAARVSGVDAVVADVATYQGERFDAVLFSYSLHHVADLERALAGVRGLLQPDGVLVAEEMAVEAVDAPTAEWYYDLQSVLLGIDPPEDPLARWAAEHPGLHTGAEMVSAIERHLPITLREPGPGLFRKLCQRLELSARGARMGSAALAIERRRVAAGTLRPLGLRIVAG